MNKSGGSGLTGTVRTHGVNCDHSLGKVLLALDL